MKKQIFALLSITMLMNMVFVSIVSADNVNEVEPNDVFTDLTNIVNNPDFTQAQIPNEADVYIGRIFGTTGGVIDANFFLNIQSNDIDMWVFDLHAGVPFKAHLDDGTNTNEALVLLQVTDQGLVPVAHTAQDGSIPTLSYSSHTVDGTYYLSLSTKNNPPTYPGGIFTTGAFSGAKITSYNGNSLNNFDYTLQFIGVFPPAPPYSLPVINSHAAQVSNSLGNGSLSWLLLSSLFGIVCLLRRRK